MRAGGSVGGSRIRRYYLGYTGSMRFIRTLDEATAFDAFESTVRFDVAVRASRWLFVHAGAVGWHGRAIIIPAPSTHGKSRLVEALVRTGATYYSDEFAVIDRRGRVKPFAKPLTLRGASGDTRRVPVTEIGSVGSAPLPVGLIVLTRYESGRTWRPREATPGESLLALLANTIRMRVAPGPTLKTVARVVEGAMTLEGPRGAADAMAQQVLRALESRAFRQSDNRHRHARRVP